MAQFTSYYPQPAYPVSVLSPRFCLQQPIDLSIHRNVMTITGGNFDVCDVNGNLIFRVKGLLVPGLRVLLDEAGSPIVTSQRKILTAHDRREVYRGDSMNQHDMIFTAKRSSMIELKTEMDVFLANNMYEDVADFKVKGSWLDQSCVVYAGESNRIVGQMYKKQC